MRFYVEADTGLFHSLASLLQLYGLHTTPLDDEQGRYFDLTPPDHWGRSRRKRFSEAIAKLRDKSLVN